MSDENQIEIPQSFIEIFLKPGRVKMTEPREVVAQRYEFCEDLAQMLTTSAEQKKWTMGITEFDVLDRVHAGLLESQICETKMETRWVMMRLSEILGWPFLQIAKEES